MVIEDALHAVQVVETFSAICGVRGGTTLCDDAVNLRTLERGAGEFVEWASCHHEALKLQFRGISTMNGEFTRNQCSSTQRQSLSERPWKYFLVARKAMIVSFGLLLMQVKTLWLRGT